MAFWPEKPGSLICSAAALQHQGDTFEGSRRCGFPVRLELSILSTP
jgi:hypothetical protein